MRSLVQFHEGSMLRHLITYFLNDDENVEECTPNLIRKLRVVAILGGEELFSQMKIKNNEIVVQNWVNYFSFWKNQKTAFFIFFNLVYFFYLKNSVLFHSKLVVRSTKPKRPTNKIL